MNLLPHLISNAICKLGTISLLSHSTPNTFCKLLAHSVILPRNVYTSTIRKQSPSLSYKLEMSTSLQSNQPLSLISLRIQSENNQPSLPHLTPKCIHLYYNLKNSTPSLSSHPKMSLSLPSAPSPSSYPTMSTPLQSGNRESSFSSHP